MPASKDEITEAGIKAILSCADERPFETITLAEVAEVAGLDLSDFLGVADTASLADAAEPYFDKAMSAEAADGEEGARERLFEVIMRRFEAMEPYRGGLLSLMKWRDRSPGRLSVLVKSRRRSAHWALVSAGLDGGNEAERVAKTVALAWVLRQTERAWRKDTNGDFARTMATLDGELQSVERRLKRAGSFVKRWSPRDKASSDADLEPSPSD